MGLGAVLFPTGTYTVTRTARGATVLGRYTPGATSTFPLVADVQAVDGDELKDLPEGRRGAETRVVYAATELVAETPNADGDVIAIDGDDWVVVRCQRYRVFANRYRAYVQRLRPS
jgi:hypothetical protein